MNDKDASLGHECRVFLRYLCELKVDPYVVQKYCEAHHKVSAYTPAPGFDELLVRFAAIRSFTRMADCYSRFFAPRSALRKKLILLIAILETSPAASVFVDTVDNENVLLLTGGLLLQGLKFVVNFTLGAALLFPCHIVYTIAPRGNTHNG